MDVQHQGNSLQSQLAYQTALRLEICKTLAYEKMKNNARPECQEASYRVFRQQINKQPSLKVSKTEVFPVLDSLIKASINIQSAWTTCWGNNIPVYYKESKNDILQKYISNTESSILMTLVHLRKIHSAPVDKEVFNNYLSHIPGLLPKDVNCIISSYDAFISELATCP